MNSMMIGKPLFPTSIPNTISFKNVKLSDKSNAVETKKPKQTIRDTIQQQISDIHEAQTNMGEDDIKAQQLIDKFKSGSKLTPGEMAYIRENAPGMVDYVERITKEREVTELAMKMAPTKTDVQFVAYQAAKQIEKEPNTEERLVRAKHLADAKHQYEQTDEYKEKPNTPLDQRKNPMYKKQTIRTNETVHIALNAYHKTNLNHSKKLY